MTRDWYLPSVPPLWTFQSHRQFHQCHFFFSSNLSRLDTNWSNSNCNSFFSIKCWHDWEFSRTFSTCSIFYECDIAKHNLILVKHCFNLFGRTTTLLARFAIVWKLNRSDKSASLFFFEEVHSALLENSCKIEEIWISYRGAQGKYYIDCAQIFLQHFCIYIYWLLNESTLRIGKLHKKYFDPCQTLKLQ